MKHGRLIDADALMEAINTWPKFGVDERGRIVPWNEGYEPYIHLRDVVIAITGMPTIDPERKKGKWIHEFVNTCTEITCCSECGKSAPFVLVSDDYYGVHVHGEDRKTDFCPNCGADMRG